MPNYIEIIRLHELSFSLRQISEMVGSSRNTVARVVKIAQAKQVSYQELSTWEGKAMTALFSPKAESHNTRDVNYALPDYGQLAKELARPEVTMQLLWEEYVDRCRRNKQIYYQLTQFRKYFNDYLKKHSFSQVLHHKAGEIVQVDWAKCKALHLLQSTCTLTAGLCTK